MALKVVGVIPARMESKRFYGKVIHPYNGKPLIYYLYHEFSKSKTIDRLMIASDSKEVIDTALGFDAETVHTPQKLKTGSDRVAAVMNETDADIFINIQADNFGLKYKVLDRVISEFKNVSSLKYGTIARKMKTDSELLNPNSVKVTLKKNGDAGWFSRHPIPFLRHATAKYYTRQFTYYYHIGVYIFRKKALSDFAGWSRTPNEKAESLEQLRILENGQSIRVFLTNSSTVSVDSPRDLKKLKGVL